MDLQLFHNITCHISLPGGCSMLQPGPGFVLAFWGGTHIELPSLPLSHPCTESLHHHVTSNEFTRLHRCDLPFVLGRDNKLHGEPDEENLGGRQGGEGDWPEESEGVGTFKSVTPLKLNCSNGESRSCFRDVKRPRTWSQRPIRTRRLHRPGCAGGLWRSEAQILSLPQ